jgi:hypothetical protein
MARRGRRVERAMCDLSEVKFRPPRSIAEGVRWFLITFASIVIAYFVVVFVLALFGVLGGE